MNPFLRSRNSLLLSLILLGAAFGGSLAQAQNLDLVGSLSYPTTLSDVWGWADGSGHEYALVGVNNGFSIVDVSTDPANPMEVAFIGGPTSIWRDIKTWNNYAYVVHDNGGTGGTGIVIVDLSNLPLSVDTQTIRFVGGVDLSYSHNIFIDEQGFLYVCGYGGTGGVAMLDLNANPEDPTLAGVYSVAYVHDLFVRGDTMWTGEIYTGEFAVVDVSDKSAPVVLARAQTPGAFAHNVWLSDDGATLFTTDEIESGYIGAFDVSDITDIQETDRWRSSPGSDVIPHNAFAYGDFVVTSYYRDGVTVHDASRPGNLVEIGRYDTSPFSGPGFDGCWGVYPYTGSGLVYATDVLTGLSILQPTYAQAAWLEGSITNSSSSAPVFGATVTLDGTTALDVSNLFGAYGTGTASAGTYSVTASAIGYYSKTVSGISLTPGVVTALDIALDPLPIGSVSGTVTDAATGAALAGVPVRFEHPDFQFETVTDASGAYTLDSVYEAEYTVMAGQWGYITSFENNVATTGGANTRDFVLDAGIYDDFAFDFGWNSLGSTWIGGSWEQGRPVAYDLGYPIPVSPSMDAEGDAGGNCYVTGNNSAFDFVHGGSVTLRSPTFDPRSLTTPTLRFDAWLFNLDTSGAVGNDRVLVRLTNGASTVTLDTLQQTSTASPVWTSYEYDISTILELGPDMRVLFAAEADGFPGLVFDVLEVGLDRFRVEEMDQPSGLVNPEPLAVSRLFPNPNAGSAVIELGSTQYDGPLVMDIHSLTGRLVATKRVQADAGRILFDASSLPDGLYLYGLNRENQRIASGRFTVLHGAR